MPSATSTRFSAPWKKSKQTIRPPRFHVPFLDGVIPLTPENRVALWDADPALDLGPISASQTVAITGLKPRYDRWSGRGIEARTSPPESADISVVFLPRNRQQAMLTIARAIQTLSGDGWLVIDGQKTDGIDAVLKAVGADIEILGRAARDHGKAAWLRRPTTLPTIVSEWVSEGQPKARPDGFVTAPGMFSAQSMDAGTTALIDAMPVGLKGRAADFGAGWGALSRHVLLRNPGITALDAVEADYASTLAAQRNVDDPRVTVHWADATRWTGGPYEVIVMNPPFHVSRAGDPQIGVAFIDAAARCLASKGALLMVANRHLPYEDTLGRHFRDRVELGDDPRFKVYKATRPIRERANGG